MPRELLSMQSGAWQEVSGTDITVENCLRSRVRDLRVEGKTYQNLIDSHNLLIVFTLDNNIFKYNFSDNPNERASIRFANNNLFKENTTYTIIVNILKNTLVTTSSMFWKFNLLNYTTSAFKCSSKNTGIVKFKLQTPSKDKYITDIYLEAPAPSTLSSGELWIAKNIIILEGDHTNTELPNSIEGIESVGEKENNILSVKINDNVTTINLPIPLRSLPDGDIDTIEGNKLIQRIGKLVVDGTNYITILAIRDNTLRLFLTDPTVKNVNETDLPFLCDLLPKTTACWGSDIEGIYQGRQSHSFVISISKAKIAGTTVNDIKSYFTTNPMTIYYELETPIVHDLTIPSIYTEKGTNIITTENNIKPELNIKVKVKK